MGLVWCIVSLLKKHRLAILVDVFITSLTFNSVLVNNQLIRCGQHKPFKPVSSSISLSQRESDFRCLLLWTNLRLFLRGSIPTLECLENGRWGGCLVQIPSLSVQLTAWRSKTGHSEAGNTWCFDDRGKSSRCLKMVWAVHDRGLWHAPWCYGWNEDHLSGSFLLLTPSSLHASWARIDFGSYRCGTTCWFDSYSAEMSSVSQLHGRTGDFFGHRHSANTTTGSVKTLTLPSFVDVHVSLTVEGKFTLEYHLHWAKQCLSDTLQQHRKVQMRFGWLPLSQIVNSTTYLLFQMNAFGK